MRDRSPASPPPRLARDRRMFIVSSLYKASNLEPRASNLLLVVALAEEPFEFLGEVVAGWEVAFPALYLRVEALF